MGKPAVVTNTRTDETVVEVRDVQVTYQRGDVAVEAVRGVSFTVNRGDFVSIQGPSGSGKSTLLRAIAGLWPLNAGEVVLEGVPLSDRSDAELSVIRRRRVGFVHQLFNLLPDLSAFDNVALPLQLDGLVDNEVRERVNKTMVSLSLETARDGMAGCGIRARARICEGGKGAATTGCNSVVVVKGCC